MTGREEPRAEKLVSCAFLFFVFYQHLYELQLGGLSRRWRAPTESSAVDGEVIHPLIPVLASFLICFLTSFLFRVIRDPILLILPSEGSHGIFYGPAARARGIDGWGSPAARARGTDGWGSPRLLGTTARRAKPSFVLFFRFKNAPFSCLSPYPSRNSLFRVRPPRCPVAFWSLYFRDIFVGQLAGGAPLRGPSDFEWAGGARPSGHWLRETR